MKKIFKFFRNVYVAIYRWYTFLLLGMATKSVQKLMVMIGKDPNAPKPAPAPYVAPKYDEMDINRAWMVDSKNRGNVWLVVDGHYIHDPKSHPILKLRNQWQEKLKAAEDKLKADRAEAARQALEEIPAPTLKEILAEADKPRYEEAQKPMVTTAEKPVIEVVKKAS